MTATMILLCYCYFGGPAGLAQEKGQEPAALWDQVKTVASMGELLQVALRYRWAEDRKVGVAGRESLPPLIAVSGVWVGVSPKVKDCGLTAEAVKTMVELQLRRNGIEVCEEPTEPNEYRAWLLTHSPRSPFFAAQLSVAIDSVSSKSGDIVAANVEVWQSQMVSLLSTPTPAVMLAETWRQSQVVLAGRSVMAEACREALNEMLETYCNDWLATHPIQKRLPPSDPNAPKRAKELG